LVGFPGGFCVTYVASHPIPGNEKADELAARGKANSRCSVDRFANCGPPGSARPPSKKPPSSEIEVIIRDFESWLCVFENDVAFALESRRDIELGARILNDHCAILVDVTAYGR
jgi:hypothetical protein